MASSAEETAHEHARALVAGNFGAAIAAMTSEALARAMAVGNTTWQVLSYALTAEGEEDGASVFSIAYQTDLGPMHLRYRVGQVEGAWKVTDVERA